MNRSYFHRGGSEPLLGATIPERFADVTRQFAEREAVVSVPQGRRHTYAALSAAVDEVARGLVALGFGTGDRVGIWSTNNVEWIVLQMATARIGTILVTINPAYRARELAHALKRSAVQGLFTIPSFRTSDYVSTLIELVPELTRAPADAIASAAFPDLRRVVVYDPARALGTARPASGFSTWGDLLVAARQVPVDALDRAAAALDPDDPINIQYTSGTTGAPKAAVLSHRSILNNAYFAGRSMHVGEHDRLCVSVPFYHCFGLVLSNLVCLSSGACVVIPCEHFDELAILRAIESERCTAIHGVPTMFIATLDHLEFGRFDLSSLRTGIMAGAPCPPALMKRVIEQMHCPEILIGYGQTEAAPLTHLTSRDDTLERRVETVGRNLCHQEVKVVHGETGATVPLGDVGEICFRGYHVMKGYYGDEEATAQAIDADGWLHSGDLGTMDAEGYVRITGRLKDMIIRAGENIYPMEVEDVIFTHPQVAQVAVFGVPDAFYGEQVMAWIQLHAGARVTEEAIRAFCKEKLAHFKVPKYVWFVDEFPMTVTGKLQKFQMRERAIERMRGEDRG